MNILMMTNTYTPIVGGLERSIESFTRQLRKHGHRVVIAAPEFEDQPENEKGVVRLPAMQNFNGTDFSVNLPVPGALKDVIKDLKPDIIHSHHPFLMGDLALRLASRHDIPVAFTYHTMYEQYTHYLPVENSLVKRFVIELSAGYANLVDQVIAPSGSVRDVLRERGVHTPIEVIPTGVNLSRFEKGDRQRLRKKYKIKEDEFVIGHVGRLAKEKNLDFLVRSVIAFLKDNEDAHFLLVGSGPMEKELNAAFEKEGVDKRVHATGTLENKKLIDAFFAMDVFAFSSKSETQGVVVAEAMAAGLPVVALDAPGVREVLDDEKNGRLLKEEDTKAFSDAIGWIKQRDEGQLKAVKEAVKTTAQKFSEESCGQKLADLYEHIDAHHIEEEEALWGFTMERIRAEWELFRNIAESTETAITERIKEKLKKKINEIDLFKEKSASG